MKFDFKIILNLACLYQNNNLGKRFFPQANVNLSTTNFI